MKNEYFSNRNETVGEGNVSACPSPQTYSILFNLDLAVQGPSNPAPSASALIRLYEDLPYREPSSPEPDLHMVGKQAVRILLECFLVLTCIPIYSYINKLFLVMRYIEVCEESRTSVKRSFSIAILGHVADQNYLT